MAKRAAKDMTLEEFDAWAAAGNRREAIAEAADEGGGPGLSLVPVPEQQDAWPTDLLRSAASGPEVPAEAFDGVPLEDSRKSLAGWSAERQRLFLTHLAETGSIYLASSAARL